jgi:hypothetical protein
MRAAHPLSRPLEDEVRDVGHGDVLDAPITQHRQIDIGEQPLSGTE